MARSAPRISRLLFALAVCGSLGFGATQALASPASSGASALACANDGYTYLGACGLDCDARCDAVTGDTASIGRCNTRGCCICLH